MNRLNIPCLFSEIDKNEDSRLLNCRIKVQHDESNLNGSYFDKEDMIKCAEKSLRRTPILGSVIYDEESEEYRLNGHDMKYEIIETEEGYDLKICHIERIFGYIPEDADISTEYDEDSNKTYLVTNGVLWKNYLDEVEDILNNNDGNTEVSMEISVNESSYNDDGLLQIKDYTFEGITMIGVPPGMKGSNLQLFSSNTKNIKQELEELIKVYSLEKEGNNLDVNKNTKHDNENFGLSADNIADQIITQINSKLVERKDYWGDKYLEREFYFMDILPDDKIAIVEDADWSSRQYFGIPYVINEDIVSLDFENKKSYIHEWREMNGDAEPKIYSIDDTQFKENIMNKFKKKDEELESELSALQESYSELKAQLDSMSDYADLKAFKESYDNAKYESEIEEISNMFSLDIEEYSDLKEKVLSKEISKEQYQEKLALKQFMKEKHEKFEKKFEKESGSSEIKIINDDIEKENLPYNGEFEKYLRR